MSTISSAVLDQAEYQRGQTATLTVTGNWGEADQVTVTTPDGATGSGVLNVLEPLTVRDDGNHVWAQVSNDGKTAVYTTTV